MKELQILFQEDMIRATLDKRKTQTRRVVTSHNTVGFSVKKKLLDFHTVYPNGSLGVKVKDSEMDTLHRGVCKYNPGDLLYVKETFSVVPKTAYRNSDVFQIESQENDHDAYIYRENFKLSLGGTQWKPSIFMPKEAARIWLRVKNVWPEPVQNISTDEIILEGVGNRQDYDDWELRKLWIELWNSINKSRGYGHDKNPVVWAISYEMLSDNGRPNL